MYNFFKKIFDLVFSIIGFIVFLPLMLLVSLLLFIFNDKQVFFIKERSGKSGNPFKLFKFKTMNDNKRFDGELLPDNQRLTKLGKFLRKSSIDELPQLINVIIGDMSLIGPRPLLPEYLPLYNSFQMRRLEVKPGITGWAQINGRNNTTWEQRFIHDVWYVDNINFYLDCKIFFLTLFKIFIREGVNANNKTTMEKFKGNG